MKNINNYSDEHLSYLKRIKRHKSFVIFMRYALLIAVIGLWEAAAGAGWIDPFITSSPSRIVETVISLYNGGELFHHIGITLYETVVGFVAGTALGTLIAVLNVQTIENIGYIQYY